MEKLGEDSSLLELRGQSRTFMDLGREGKEGDQDEFRASLDIQRQRFEKAAGGLLAACGIINSLNDKKSYLLISTGIPDISTFSRDNIRSETADRGSILDAIHPRDQEQYGKIRIFDPIKILKEETFERTDQVIQELVHFANSRNISIYSLDPATFVRSVVLPSAADFTQNKDMYSRMQNDVQNRQRQNIRHLSEKTGASFFRGSSKFEHLAEAFGEDKSRTYRLAFRSKRQSGDNRIHKIQVKTTVPGVDIDTIKEYKDYSTEETNRFNLVSAFYGPEYFRDIPFDADFFPFLAEDGSVEPWINLSIPKEVLLQEMPSFGDKKNFQLHFWIQQKGGAAEGLRGELRFPFEYTESQQDLFQSSPFLRFSYKGKNLRIQPGEHSIILALVDETTQRLGAIKSRMSIPERGENGDGLLFNCVLGVLEQNQKYSDDSFVLNGKTGALEHKTFLFFPIVPRRITQWQDVYAFVQAYSPEGPITSQPEISVENQSDFSNTIKGTIVSQTYNKKLRIWNAVIKLNTLNIYSGENTVQITFPISQGKSLVGPKMDLYKSQE